MLLLLPFPNIDPEIFAIDLFGFHLALRWYAVAYIVGIIIGWRMLVRLMKRTDIWGGKPPLEPTQAEDILTWQILGIVLGGRLGYVFFYNFGYYMDHPGEILQVWTGGMSFHGGFLGVVIATIAFARLHKASILSVGDAMCTVVPIGLLLGRIANFIKPELWGRPTNVPWAVSFPDPVAQTCPDTWLSPFCTRHPSQLYEAGLEGLVLGILMLILVYRRDILKWPGRAMGVFFMFYGAARIFVELFRQADAQYVTFDNPWGHVIRLGDYGITQGQLLSLPMIVVGLILFIRAKKNV